MEVNASQSSRSAQIKRLGDDVKAYLEEWYERTGRPSAVSLAEKTSIMHHIQSEIEPAGITLSQLKRWFMLRRCAERTLGRSPVTPRRKRVGMSILFPTLTDAELDHLKVLVEENPNPSSDLLMVWVDSPLLPNVTLEDAHRFVKYIQAQMQTDHNTKNLSPPPRYWLHQQDHTSGDGDQSDEEDMLDDQSYLITPEPTLQDPNPRIIESDPFLSSTLCHPPPISLSPPIQLPREPRALLDLLRSHLSTDELKQLLQEGRSDVTSMSQTLTPNVESTVSNQLTSPESQPHSPIPSSPHKSSPSSAHSYLSSPGEDIESGDSAYNMTQTIPAYPPSPRRLTPYSPKKTTIISSPGFVSRKIFMDLAKLSFEATGDHISPDQFLTRFELCQKKSQELTTALERGYLRDFGMLPSEELKALDFQASDLTSRVALS